MRFGCAALLILTLELVASPSDAAKPARACIDAHAQGQVERNAGRWLSASQHFHDCAVDACPALIRKECAEFDAALEAQIPTVVLRAEDARGEPIPGARATIDEARQLPRLDSSPIPLDPGVHQIQVLLDDGRHQTLNFSLSEGEKARPAVARFKALEPRPIERRGHEHQLAYIVGGAGLLSLGAFGAFAWDGRRRQDELEKCAPNCTSRSQVDGMRRSYLIADILLGISAAALGTSAYLLITNDSDEGAANRTVMVGTSGRF